MGEFSKTINNGAEDISVKDRFFALEHHTQAFQAQAGIDILPRQRRASAVEVLVELHEDQVPDLKVAFAFAARFTIGPATAILGTAIKVDLGIRSARAGGTGRTPPVIFQAYNGFIRKTCYFAPVPGSLVILWMNGGMQPLSWQFEHPG